MMNQFSMADNITFHRLVPFSSFLGGSYLDSHNMGTVYAIMNLIALLCRANCALQHGTNICDPL